MESVRSVAVVEDHPALNRAMSILLTEQGHDVRSYGSAEDLLDDGPFLDHCMCLLLDVRLPGMSGLDVLKLLQGRDDPPAVLVLTGSADVPTAVEAMRLGAVDLIEKPCMPTALVESVGKACDACARRRSAVAERIAAAGRLRQLSRRQRQVLAGMVEGQSNKIIAFQLKLSVRTVEAYRAQILDRLGVRTTTEAVRIALAAPHVLGDSLYAAPAFAAERDFSRPGGDSLAPQLRLPAG